MYLEELRKTTEKLGQDGLCPGKDSKREPLEYNQKPKYLCVTSQFVGTASGVEGRVSFMGPIFYFL
jgi:hypothetical protein